MRVQSAVALVGLISFEFVSSVPSVRAAPVRDLGRTWDAPDTDKERYGTGFLDVGTYLGNHGGAASARPDGSGSALFQYHGFLEDSVTTGAKFLADLNFITDRFSGLAVQARSLDYLLGLSSMQGNVKYQFDREESLPLDISGRSYRYWDVRGSYLIGAPPILPGQAGNHAGKGGLCGVLGVGYMLHNGDTPARLDNSGRAFMRYRAGINGALQNGTFLFRADGDILTDRDRRKFSPADLDLSLGVGTVIDEMEIMFYRKSRQALDQPGYAGYYFLSLRKYFDSRNP